MAAVDKEALKNAVMEALKPIQDPEIRIGIVDLGLVYDVIASDEGEVTVKMTLTTPACPYGEMLLSMTHRAAEDVEGVTKVEVVLVWEPVWDPAEMASDLAKDQLGIW
ncbi:MAG: metal-sulfur cluster assembly factor [candidate division Zixibacteria bacterium]|nr:metal-sulfur cluster assembly factor [candidate division Zixibacteria bacterium]